MATPLSAAEFKKQFPPTANGLTAQIIREISMSGGFATRINTQGQWDPSRKVMRTGHTVKGMTDIVGVYKALALFVEVKVGKDRLSPFQLDVQASVERAGGRWFCARDFESFLKWFQGL